MLVIHLSIVQYKTKILKMYTISTFLANTRVLWLKLI